MDWNRFLKFAEKCMKDRFQEAAKKLHAGQVKIEVKPSKDRNPEKTIFLLTCSERTAEVSLQWFADTNRGDKIRQMTETQETYTAGDYIVERYEGMIADLLGEAAKQVSRENEKLLEVMERAGVDWKSETKYGSASGENIRVD